MARVKNIPAKCWVSLAGGVVFALLIGWQLWSGKSLLQDGFNTNSWATADKDPVQYWVSIAFQVVMFLIYCWALFRQCQSKKE